MKIESITVGAFGVNAYLLEEAAAALVIDPGDEADLLLKRLRERRLKPLAYLLTHGHVDHLSALAALHREFPAPVAIHPLDAEWAFTEANQFPPHYPVPEAPAAIDRELADGQTWVDGPFIYQVLALPGHSPGGVGFYFPREHVLFSGDTLFEGTVGRSDLPGADPRVLARSLRRLQDLPDQTQVYAGHGTPTTIGAERRANFFFRQAAGRAQPG